MAKKIGQLLMEQGLLTKAQLQTALRTQQFFGGHLGSIFIELGFLSEQVLGDALSQSSGIHYAPPEYLEGIPPEVYQLVSATLADKYKLIPLRVEHGRLHLAMLHPKDLRAINQISSLVGLAVVPYITPEFRIFEALERYYRIQRKRSRAITMDTPSAEVNLATLSASQPQADALSPATVRASQTGTDVGLDGLPMDAEFSIGGMLTQANPATPSSATGMVSSLPERSTQPTGTPSAAPTSGVPPSLPLPESKPAMPSGVAAESDRTLPADNARLLLQAQNRDEIGQVLLQVTENFFRRRLLFILQRDRIVGWDGAGDGVAREDVKRVLLPLDSLSLFTAVKVGSRPMIGPVADVPANRRLFHEMRLGFPAEVVLFPIRIRDRVVAIYYGDNATQPVGSVDVDLLRRITLQAALALEILLLRGKLLAL